MSSDDVFKRGRVVITVHYDGNTFMWATRTGDGNPRRTTEKSTLLGWLREEPR